MSEHTPGPQNVGKISRLKNPIWWAGIILIPTSGWFIEAQKDVSVGLLLFGWSICLIIESLFDERIGGAC